MVVMHTRSKRKPSGGRYTSTNPKRQHAIGRNPSMTKIEEETRLRTNRTKGGSAKTRVIQTNKVNLLDGKKAVVAEIEGVLENPANRHFVRRNILTKGTIIETNKGRARITNSPGQDGIVNAVKAGEQ